MTGNDGVDLEEVKAFLKSKNVYVSAENMGYCKGCGRREDLRDGYCFDCTFPLCPLESCGFKYATKVGVFDYRFVTENHVHCTRPEGLCALAKNMKAEKKGGALDE